MQERKREIFKDGQSQLNTSKVCNKQNIMLMLGY